MIIPANQGAELSDVSNCYAAPSPTRARTGSTSLRNGARSRRCSILVRRSRGACASGSASTQTNTWPDRESPVIVACILVPPKILDVVSAAERIRR
jgi:hypothetical protein